MPTTAAVRHIGERKLAGSSSARQLNRIVRGSHGRSGEAKEPRRYCSVRGYIYRKPRTLREFQYSSLPEPALFSAGNCLRSAVQGRNSEASHHGKGKTLKSPPIGGFSEFSRRAVYWNVTSCLVC